MHRKESWWNKDQKVTREASGEALGVLDFFNSGRSPSSPSAVHVLVFLTVRTPMFMFTIEELERPLAAAKSYLK